MTRPHRRVYQHLPNGKLRFQPFVWTIAIFAILGALISVGAETLRGLEVPSQHIYTGTLAPKASPIAVLIPARTAMTELLVEPSDRLRKGQTILVLDQGLIGTELAKLRAEQAEAQAELVCLEALITDPKSIDERVVIPQNLGHSSPPQDRSCAAMQQQLTEISERLANGQNKTGAEIALIDEYLNQIAAQTDLNRDPIINREQIDRAFALSLTKIDLEHQSATQLRIAKSERAAISLARDKRVAGLKIKMHAQASEITLFEALHEAPRVQAPLSGRVQRLRPLPLGVQVQTDTEVLSILPTTSAGYRVHFDIPETTAGFASLGQNVHVKIIGLPDFDMALSAQITNISPQDNERLMITADLNAEASQVLANSPYSRQVQANDSAVSVRIHGANIAIMAYAQRLFENDLILKKPQWFEVLSRNSSARFTRNWLPQAFARNKTQAKITWGSTPVQ